MGLGTSDEGVEEHEFLSELLEVSMAFDQVNSPDLVVFEHISVAAFSFGKRFAAIVFVNIASGRMGMLAWIQRSVLYTLAERPLRLQLWFLRHYRRGCQPVSQNAQQYSKSDGKDVRSVDW